MTTVALFVCTAATLFTWPAAIHAAEPPKMPRIAGEWWTVASDPDLGELTSPKQQPVDFGIWQAADNTWQLWSCIRSTKEPGKTRLFHRWEGKRLEDRDWQPKGIAMHADSTLGETAGGLQAPFVFREGGGGFKMLYGDWVNICLATSDDGKTFMRHHGEGDRPQIFRGASEVENSRDPMALRIGDLWYCYYTAHPDKHGSVYARTSRDLLNWSEPRIVAARGQAGDGPYSAECPFVVEPEPGHFYLFRTQHYGIDATTRVYYSRDPLNFGIDDDANHFVTALPVAAPELIKEKGKWFIAALLPSLKGIQIAPFEWASPAR